MEEHIIFEQYTDMDKNIDVLARIKAECIHAKKYKQCSGRCSSCDRNTKFQACYKELALCDQLNLDSKAQYIAASFSKIREDIDIEHAEVKKIKIFLYISLIVVLSCIVGVLIC